MADYGQGQGLSTLADSMMGAYGAMHGMDMQDAALAVRKKQLDFEAQKLNAELAEKERLRQQQLSERSAMGPLSQAAAGAGPAELPGIIQRHIPTATDPYAAAQAAKVYGEGVGGFLPAAERFKSQQHQEFAANVSAHAADPVGFPADALARAAVRLQISPDALPNFIPEITTKPQIMKSYYEELNKSSATAGGLGAAPGKISLPGILPPREQAVSATPEATPEQGSTAPRTSDMLYGPGRTAGAPGVLPARSGDVLARQAGLEAQTRATGTATGTALALGRQLPGGQTVGQAEAGQAGLVAQAKEETPQGKQRFAIDQQIKEYDKQLKQIQIETDPIHRGELATRMLQNMAMTGYLVGAMAKDDPLKADFEQIQKNTMALAKAGTVKTVRPPIPAPNPAPAAPTTPIGGKIHVRRKADGLPGSIDPKDFNPMKYEVMQ